MAVPGKRRLLILPDCLLRSLIRERCAMDYPA